MRVLDEAGARGPEEEDFLEHVEGDVGDGEELASIEGGETNVGYGVIGEVLGTQGQVFNLSREREVTMTGRF